MENNIDLADEFLKRGNRESENGKYYAAIACYQKAESHNPANPMIYYNIAKLFYITEQYDNAVANYLRYILMTGLEEAVLKDLGHALLDAHCRSEFRTMYRQKLDCYFHQCNQKEIDDIGQELWLQAESYDAFCIEKAKEFIVIAMNDC